MIFHHIENAWQVIDCYDIGDWETTQLHQLELFIGNEFGH